MKSKITILATALVIIFTACSKDKDGVNGVKLAGLYKVVKWEYNTYTDGGKTIATTTTKDSIGYINLIFNEDKFSTSNTVNYKLSNGKLMGWRNIPKIYWDPGETNATQLFFSNSPNGENTSSGIVYTAGYNVIKEGKNKFRWVWIGTNNNGMSEQETLWVERL